jgi:thiamine kinase-like enzyme
VTAVTSRTYHSASEISEEIYDHAVGFLERNGGDLLGPDVHLTKLQGGASNVNLAVESNGAKYALRLCDADAARWGVDRAAAITAQNEAAELGLAPKILASELPQGDYLAEFIPGFQLTPDLLHNERYLAMVAGAWRRLNASSTHSRVFSPFDDARTFIDCADADHAPRPDRLDEMLAALLRVEALFVNHELPKGFCHSDSVPQNYLVDGEVIRLVDFDYAGYGWTAFELGSLCCQAELDSWRTQTLLTAYDLEADAGQRARVELMRFVAGIREATWALMAEPYLGYKTAPLDGWTYEGHAARNIRQAAQVIDSGAFEDYLRMARNLRPEARC